MEHCSKGKGKRVTSATKHLVNFENRVGREASSEAASLHSLYNASDFIPSNVNSSHSFQPRKLKF